MSSSQENQKIMKRTLFREKSFTWSRTSQQNLQDLYRPQFDQYHKDNAENQKLWNLMANYIPRTIESIQSQFVKHIEYTLVKTRFNFDRNTAYQAISHSVRDRLIESFNDTQQQLTIKDCKRVNYLSLEFLIGRCLQNALVNIDLEEKYKEALQDLGYNLEDLYEEETDAALGNGGLGRLAACFLDSLATLNYPAWGYGLRYNYGIFKQVLQNGHQIEIPDYWLDKGYPWEIERLDVSYPVRFYGYVERYNYQGKEVINWVGGEVVKAVAYDNPIPGYDTFNTISLRLWRSCPMQEFDFKSFNQNDYQQSIIQKQRAEVITSVLYPKDDTYEGKELRLKQEYLLVSASIQDIVRRFKKRKNYDWQDFCDKNAVQLNDTHPALAPIELLRIFIDEEKVDKKIAFDIVYKTFAYTNHTLLPEALERVGVDIMGHLLPRHLEIIYEVNHQYLEKISAKYPGNNHKLSNMSCVEEGPYKKIKMANVAIINSHTVNGVAALHSKLVKQDLFNDFFQHRPSKFQNKTNGVTPRRWVRTANPKLADFYSKRLGNNE